MQAYSCGECTHGRLGIGKLNGFIEVPTKIDFNGDKIAKISIHSGQLSLNLTSLFFYNIIMFTMVIKNYINN